MIIKTYKLYQTLLTQSHVLIAGSTGTGKSVLLNNLIYTALSNGPDKIQFILIDPKRVELIQYKNLPHVLDYACLSNTMIQTLISAVDLMEKRFDYMQFYGLKKYPGNDIYIVIDEFADLMTTNKKDATALICRLTALGRAAKMHVILCTQRPTSEIITGLIKTNLDTRIALRVPTKQDSRNIINIAGAENLPRYGQAYVIIPPEKPKLYEIPMIDESETQSIIDYWTS